MKKKQTKNKKGKVCIKGGKGKIPIVIQRVKRIVQASELCNRFSGRDGSNSYTTCILFLCRHISIKYVCGHPASM